MTNDIRSLDTIALFLEQRGFDLTQTEHAVIANVGGFQTVFTIDDVDGDGDADIRISCQLLTLNQIPESRIPAFAIAALDLNTRILPYSVATLTATDDPSLTDSSESPVILTDSLPIGDISEDEFQSAIDSLLIAILSTRELLTIGLGEVEASEIQFRRSQISRSQLTSLARGLRGRSIDADFDVEDLLDLFVELAFIIDDGFFFGEEPIFEDPLAEDEVVVVDENIDETLPSESAETFSDPAPVVEETPRYEPPPSFDEPSTRSSFGGDSSSSSFDSGSSDSCGGGGCDD